MIKFEGINEGKKLHKRRTEVSPALGILLP